jgi:uncharacterized lipoprotein YddW (UPF0748 family)
MWVATVNNMDWPSQPGLSAEEQQRELLAILDRAAQLNMNTIVFQVRPEADALYRSELEPWSRFLTGEQGKSPGWDPLAFAVTEAHKRGLELHAWFNPYRVAFNKTRPRARTHVSRRRPDLVVEYSNFLWMDPALPEVRQSMIRVITDVVRRYDVDGVHIDDYFYPYPESRRGRVIPFPDARTYRQYRARGGELSLGDWRRRNVDILVREFYAAVKNEKSWVKVGISPFGIWRPGYPATTTAGLDQYAELFADVRKWLHEGWLDYLAPQLYWPTRPEAQSFPVLLRWWVDESRRGRHVWPGLALYKLPLAGSRRMRALEIAEQVQLTRAQPGAEGHIHFNAKIVMDNVDGIGDYLARLYAEPVLPPAFPWLDSLPPARPEARVARQGAAAVLHLSPTDRQEVAYWVLQARVNGRWERTVLPGVVRAHILGGSSSAELLAISAVDRTGNISDAAILRLDPQ